MSRVAYFDGSTDGMMALFDKADKLCDEFFETAVIEDRSQTAELFKLYDTVLTQGATLSAMLCFAEAIGTYGSAFVDRKPDRCVAKRETRTLTRWTAFYIEKISKMSEPELWFEKLLVRKTGDG